MDCAGVDAKDKDRFWGAVGLGEAVERLTEGEK